jgi:hypothetical protein
MQVTEFLPKTTMHITKRDSPDTVHKSGLKQAEAAIFAHAVTRSPSASDGSMNFN